MVVTSIEINQDLLKYSINIHLIKLDIENFDSNQNFCLWHVKDGHISPTWSSKGAKSNF